MLSFNEIDSGDKFELLVREVLRKEGLRVYWSGVGQDGGKDLLAIEEKPGIICNHVKRWLVQCKHNSSSSKSVGIGDVPSIVDDCNQHGTTGYLLVCSTHPTSSVVKRLEEITKNENSGIDAYYWDGVILENILDTPLHWPTVQRFLPESAAESGVRVYSTLYPNRWIIVHRGYYFQYSNRIGSNYQISLNSFDKMIDAMEAVEFPEGEFLRLRYVWYDDKNGAYTIHVDYMHKWNTEPHYHIGELESILRSGLFDEYGYGGFWEFNFQEYNPDSDHYDKDHYDYYEPFMSDMHIGSVRHQTSRRYRRSTSDEFAPFEAYRIEDREQFEEQQRTKSFDMLKKSFGRVPFIHVVRGANSSIEYFDKLARNVSWEKILERMNFEPDLFFSARIYFTTDDVDRTRELFSKFPQEVFAHFRSTICDLFLPEKGYCDQDESEKMREITFSIHPASIENIYQGRRALNEYFDKIRVVCEEFVSAGAG